MRNRNRGRDIEEGKLERSRRGLGGEGRGCKDNNDSCDFVHIYRQ
jgi:hypothetical protein